MVAQLGKDTEAFGRIAAAQALAKMGGLDAVRALEKVLKEDGFWTVRAEAAQALGSLRSSNAEQVLLAALDSEQHPKVRRAIASALGEFRDEAAASALARILQGDKTDLVESAAASALGKTHQPQAFDALVGALGRSSFNEVVRAGAINGLVATRDDRATSYVLDWTTYGRPNQARFAAIAALGTLGKQVKEADKEQIIDRLKDLLDDKHWRARVAAITAAHTLGDTALAGML